MTTQGMTIKAMNRTVDDGETIKGRSLWKDAYYRIRKEKLAVFCFFIILFYAFMAFASKVGLIASPWDTVVGGNYQPPSFESFELIFGTDIFGRSVLYKAIHGAQVAFGVGLVSSFIAVTLGVVLGSVAGYFGGIVDDLVVWFYTTLGSIPNFILLIAIAFVLGKGITTIYIALGVTYWIGLARVIRGEVIKHKNREYVVAARSLGASHASRIFKHILPNVFHQVIISFSILFQAAIKAEVILSYLGLGVQGQPSWGIMIDDAKLELAREVWWQLGAATLFMFFLVLAFNIFGDTLRDALDPKLK